jgi:hypothetical protein
MFSKYTVIEDLQMTTTFFLFEIYEI